MIESYIENVCLKLVWNNLITTYIENVNIQFVWKSYTWNLKRTFKIQLV